MKIISFVWNKNYIYIFIVTIILLITNIYNALIYKNNKNYLNFIVDIFNMIGQFLTIIFFLNLKKNK